MIRVGHVITRLILGGAQENTLASVVGHARGGSYEAELVVGPTWGPEGSLIPEARAHGVTIWRIPSLLREVNPVLDPVALAHLAGHFRRRRYDIVHTHSSKAGILGRLAARMARVPIVVHTVHGWAFNERQRPIIRRVYVELERRCAALSDALITVAPRLQEKGVRFGVGSPDLFVNIRSGIDLERYARPERDPRALRRELGIPEDAPVIGSVMRLSPPKAPHLLIQAAGEVSRELPDAHVVIVGEGPLRAQAEAETRRERLEGRVHLVGLRENVPDYLAIFDVFVLPTFWEGLPRVLPQAMAAGLPVVASAVDGNADIVDAGVNGFLVPPDDTRAYARAILEILRDEALARRMGEVGRRTAQAFDVRHMVRDIEALYDRLVSAKGLIADAPASRSVG